MLRTKRQVIVLLVVLLTAGRPSSASAQEEEAPPEFEAIRIELNGPAEIRLDPNVAQAALMERAKKAHEKRIQRRLRIRIEQLRRTCELSPAQVRRLELAAKGAVRHALTEFEDQVVTWQREMMGGEAIADADVAVEEAETAAGTVLNAVAGTALDLLGFGEAAAPVPRKKVPAGQDPEVFAFTEEIGEMYGPFEMLAGSGGSTKVEEQKLWQAAIKSTLSTKQLAKYETQNANRRKFRRRTAVAGLVAGIDEHLLMSDEQREKMTRLVDRELGKFLAAISPMQQAYLQEMFEHMSSTQKAYARLRRGARGILSKDQYEQFMQNSQDANTDISTLLSEAVAIDFEEVMEVPDAEEPEPAAWLGVSVSADQAAVQTVTDNSPAQKAGLRVGDIIRGIDSTRVRSRNDLLEVLEEMLPGQKVTLRIERDGKERDIEVELGNRF